MIKVKLLASSGNPSLEQMINDFIADKEVIDIKYQSIWYPTNYNERGWISNLTVDDRALIIYKEKGR